MTNAKIEDIMDGWLYAMRRSMIRQRVDWQFAIVLAGILQDAASLHQSKAD